jgi:hypothetical protein
MKEYYVGWFTLVFINGCIAHAFNKSRLFWCLLSLVLGPLATLMLLILGKTRAGESK